MRLSRTDRSRLADWWFSVDHALVGAILVLMSTGLVLSLAASPAIALKRGLPTYYYVERHAVHAVLGAIVMIVVSFLAPARIRRLALAVLLASLAMLVAVYFNGTEVKGAQRWLRVAGFSIQPSEAAKPAFVVIAAWLFAEAGKRRDIPALPLAIALYAILAALLLAQPDVGQTMLVTVVWGTLLFLSGQPLRLAAGFGVVGLAVFAGAWATLPYVRWRLARFLDPSRGDTYQVDRARQSFVEGGLFGKGPGEGAIKHALPDAHTDFVLAVVAEEYGVIACLALLALLAFVVFRAIVQAGRDPDTFARLAITGLALTMALQTLVNAGVNVGLLPAKGMTLPFISAGGSSSLALAFGAGMMLALLRRRPDAARVKMPPLSTATAGPPGAMRVAALVTASDTSGAMPVDTTAQGTQRR